VINTIRPGEPGATAVVLLTRGRVLVVALRGSSVIDQVPVPRDLLVAGGSVCDAVMLAAGRLALASTNGRLGVFAVPGGRELEGRVVSAPGFLSAWSGDNLIALGDPDGTVQLLNASTLAVVRSSKVLAEGIIDIQGNTAGSLLAAQSHNHVAVLAVPELFAVGHTQALNGLGSVAFEPSGSTLLLGIDVAFTGGGNEASLRSWPLCTVCAGPPAKLGAAAATIASWGAGIGAAPSGFVPHDR
jgi:hypothetical protein